jgi:hypothetical protein
MQSACHVGNVQSQHLWCSQLRTDDVQGLPAGGSVHVNRLVRPHLRQHLYQLIACLPNACHSMRTPSEQLSHQIEAP